MEHFEDLEFALRLPSFAFALLTFVATAWLAHILFPLWPISIPCSILILASSKFFWSFATSALLEAGAVFFSRVATAATLRALQAPVWWYGAAVAIGLGALQKAPIALVFCALTILAVKLADRKDGRTSPSFQSEPHFRLASKLCLALVLCWPVIQFIRHGWTSLEVMFKETAGRFAPFGLFNGSVEADWSHVLFEQEPLVWLPAMAAAVGWACFSKDRFRFVVPVIFLVFSASMWLSSGSVYDRYVLLIMPLLAASLSGGMAYLLQGRLIVAAVVAGVLVLSGARPYKADELGLLRESQEKYKSLYRSLREAQAASSELLFVLDPSRPLSPFPGAVSHFAAAGRPVLFYRSSYQMARSVARGKATPPFQGLSPDSAVPVLKVLFTDLRVRMTQMGYVHWEATAADAGAIDACLDKGEAC